MLLCLRQTLSRLFIGGFVKFVSLNKEIQFDLTKQKGMNMSRLNRRECVVELCADDEMTVINRVVEKFRFFFFFLHLVTFDPDYVTKCEVPNVEWSFEYQTCSARLPHNTHNHNNLHNLILSSIGPSGADVTAAMRRTTAAERGRISGGFGFVTAYQTSSIALSFCFVKPKLAKPNSRRTGERQQSRRVAWHLNQTKRLLSSFIYLF